MTYSSIYTGAQVDDAVAKRHAQNTDTALDTGGANQITAAEIKADLHVQGTDQGLDTGGVNAITAAVLSELANAERRDQFYDTILKPAGLTIAPDVLYWPSPYRAARQDATIARPGTATRFNSQGILETIPANVIRRDYDPVGGFRGALAEPQRTNLVLWSEDLGNAAWAKAGATVAANALDAPDGNLTADTLTATTGAAQVLTGAVSFAAATYTLSAFVKRGTSNTVTVAMETGSTANRASATLNFTTGVVTTAILGTFSAPVATVAPVGNGWFRLTLTATLGTAANGTARFYVGGYNATTIGETVSVWGAQLEQASFASSYIPTEATTVTRPADTLTIPQVGDRRRGLIVWQGSPRFDAAAGSGANAVLRFPLGRSDTQQAIRIVGATGIEAISPSAADVQAVTALSTLQGRKSCIAYWWDSDANVFGVSVDGVSAVNSATTFSAPASDPIRIGQTAANRQGASHTEWAFISYNIPPTAQINALTAGVL